MKLINKNILIPKPYLAFSRAISNLSFSFSCCSLPILSSLFLLFSCIFSSLSYKKKHTNLLWEYVFKFVITAQLNISKINCPEYFCPKIFQTVFVTCRSASIIRFLSSTAASLAAFSSCLLCLSSTMPCNLSCCSYKIGKTRNTLLFQHISYSNEDH